MSRALAVVASVLLALPPARAAAAAHVQPSHKASKHQPKPATQAGRPTLASATAAMKALMRDRSRRQFRHNWERAIQGILATARGPDAAAAWLEAGKARYALYRWSANELDRDKALLLANRAAQRGSKDARALAAAIRREAGDDAPAVAQRPRPPTRGARPVPAPAPRPEREPPAEEEESPPDPTLAAALEDLDAGSAVPKLALGQDGAQGAAEVAEVRSWSSGDYSRVAVYLSHWVGWQKLELPAEAGQPRRLAFDFRPATLAGKALMRGVSGGQIDRVRAAQNAADTVRVVLDLPGREEAQVFALEDPPRLVVDVGNRAAAAPPVAEAAPPVPREAPEPGAPPPAIDEDGGHRRVRRVVVDAGHGGHDPGAIGRHGLREKDVTLDMGLRISAELKAQGFEVVLTRDRDQYLRLEDRTALANTSGADLFVSVHANANPRRNRTGIETYFLNVTDNRYAARLAARENGLDVDADGGGEELRRIRADLDAVTSAGPSRRLAELVQHELCRSVRGRFGEVQDLGVKSALFYVLLGARMPAILVETGFISNPAEEKRLASAPYRAEVARSVARAVRTFARPDERVAAAR